MRRILGLALVVGSLFVDFSKSWAAEHRQSEDIAEVGVVFIVTATSASLYTSPLESKRTVAVLKRGRRFVSSGSQENGFIAISTRSGARTWIRAADVRPEARVPEAAIGQQSGQSGAGRALSQPAAPSRFGLHRVSFDLGASVGSAGSRSYTEIELGLSLYFKEWLAWRNGVFSRFQSGAENVYGLDTGVRAILDFSGAVGGATVFAGPGYRFVSRGEAAPFVEAGLVLKLLGVSIGGGAKTVFNSSTRSGSGNDTQYFLILAGGGSL